MGSGMVCRSGCYNAASDCPGWNKNLNTIDVASSSSSEWQVYTVDYLDGLLYLLRRYAGGSPTMDLLKPDGSDCGQISLPAAYGYAVPGSDDVMYYVQKTDSGNLVYQLDAEK